MATASHRLLLIGGGHSHVEVLRRFALAPEPRIALALVSPDASLAYSGMLPGTVAGHYAQDASAIALAPLAQWANARFIRDRVTVIDPSAHHATLATDERVEFDTASIDVGSTPSTSLPGALEHAIAVKPVASFLQRWDAMLADARAGRIASVAVVGGGAGGVEILLAMQFRLQALLGAHAPRFALVTDALHLPVAARRRIVTLLQARGVAIHAGSAVAAIDAGGVTLQSGASLPADRIVVATSAAAAPWLAASGLACDAQGFIRVDRHLRSVSHPSIFAAGDCASQDEFPRPKSGVFAVRQGPALAANLRAAMFGASLAPYLPQRHALALIATGGRHAIAVRGAIAVAGGWVWRWKDRIDHRFVARYRPR